MWKKLFCLIPIILCFGFNAFAQDWFDMSMPNMDRKAALVSTDSGRAGYTAAVNLINRLSNNRAEDVSVQLAKEVSPDQITQLALQLFYKSGQLGTFVMVADIPSGKITVRYYYIICAGWDETYLYAFAQML